jgi:hypothetical protein
VSRKYKAIAALGLLAASVTIIHIVHALTLDRTVRFVEVDFRCENWPLELDGYRIGFMTDFHTITDKTMREVAVELNARGLDLLLLGGDFSMRGAHYRGTLGEIAKTATTDGIFGVEGNHDDYTLLFSAMERNGIIPLDNGGFRIREGFYLAGVRDVWNGAADTGEAISGAEADDFILLVSHNPDIAMLQPTKGIDLILSGHTHRGQITFFGYPMYLLRGSITRYGTRFAHGFATSAEGIPVFVSGGVGSYYTIPRVFARPEVVVFTIFNK